MIRARAGKRWLAALTAALLLAALCSTGVALGADQTDPTFGQDGVAIAPEPQKAALAEAGIWDLANAPDGKMAAALAGFASYGYFGAARLNDDGSLDTSFGEGGFTAGYEVPVFGEVNPPPPFHDTYKTQAQGVAVQTDGKVVLAGYLELEYFNHDLAYSPVLARYGTNGNLDPSFGEGGVVAPGANSQGGDDVLHAVAATPSGRIIAVGAEGESRYGYGRSALVLAYAPDGELDRSFGLGGGRVLFRDPNPRPNLTSTVLTAVRILPSGKILMAGYLYGRLLLLRLTSGGRLDRSFGGGDGKVTLKSREPVSCCGEWASLAIWHGKILLEGRVNGRRGEHLALARFTANGRLDKSFGKNGQVPVGSTWRMPNPRDIAVQGDGRIVVAGYGFPVRKGEPSALSFRALRYLPSGRLDRSFGEGGLQLLSPGVQNAAFAALTQADGQVVAAGALANGTSHHYESELMSTRFLVRPAG